MPRPPRHVPGGLVYHVMNRGNRRQTIFHKPADFDAFLRIMQEAKARVRMRLLGWCVMGNHWHLVCWPEGDGVLSAFVGHLCNTHVHRYRQHYHDVGDGHVYQGRFKSFPVQTDEHFFRVMRYVEANALRAGLVSRAEDWPYGSLRHALGGNPGGLQDAWPVDRPADWVDQVNASLPDAELGEVRRAVGRGRPLGQAAWVQGICAALGLAQTLRPRGRPRRPAPAPHSG